MGGQGRVETPLRIRIQDFNPDGRGRGRTGGRAVLVSQALPGEVVAVRVDRSTEGTVQGRVERLLEGRPGGRHPHACPHEFACTGCPLLGAPPPEEAGFKLQRLRVALEQAGVTLEPGQLQVPAGPFGYRHYAKQVFGVGPRGAFLGSYVTGTHELADNRGCPVLHPGLARLLDVTADEVRRRRLPIHEPGGQPGWRYALARRSASTGEQLLVLACSRRDAPGARRLADDLLKRDADLVGVQVRVNDTRGNTLLAGSPLMERGRTRIREQLLGFQHQVGPLAFFQVNLGAAEVLFRAALEMAGEGPSVVETHAGVGAMTLPLTRTFRRVVAVEAVPEAAASLERGAQAAGLGPHRLEVVTGRVEEELEPLLAREGARVLVADPPRAGLGARTASVLGRSSVQRVVLLSCSMDALSRDLELLSRAGFEPVRLAPVDQLPRTAHLETATLLERRPDLS